MKRKQDINIIFCRRLLTLAGRDLKKHFPHLGVMKDASVLCQSGGINPQWFWEGPQGSTWQGHADNAYEARYEGWMAWLRARGIDGTP